MNTCSKKTFFGNGVFATPRPVPQGTPRARGELGSRRNKRKILLWPEEYGVERREVSPISYQISTPKKNFAASPIRNALTVTTPQIVSISKNRGQKSSWHRRDFT